MTDRDGEYRDEVVETLERFPGQKQGPVLTLCEELSRASVRWALLTSFAQRVCLFAWATWTILRSLSAWRCIRMMRLDRTNLIRSTLEAERRLKGSPRSRPRTKAPLYLASLYSSVARQLEGALR